MDLETFNALPRRSAVAELTSCCSSLGNDAITERCVLRSELAKINQIRLGRLVSA